jgi:hypothetical protein
MELQQQAVQLKLKIEGDRRAVTEGCGQKKRAGCLSKFT